MMKMSSGQQGRHRCSCGGLSGVAGQHACNPSPSDPQVQRVTQEGIMTTPGAVDRSDNVTVPPMRK